MPKTLAPLTLALTLLLLSSTLGVAAPKDWNALLFDAKPDPAISGPARRLAREYATCAAYTLMLSHYRTRVDVEPVKVLQRRYDLASRAVMDALGDGDAASLLITRQEERLALTLVPNSSYYHTVEALRQQYDAPCTALLLPLTEKE